VEKEECDYLIDDIKVKGHSAEIKVPGTALLLHAWAQIRRHKCLIFNNYATAL
jgi:hypothetical protein